jgi:hypothetical protein
VQQVFDRLGHEKVKAARVSSRGDDAGDIADIGGNDHGVVGGDLVGVNPRGGYS